MPTSSSTTRIWFADNSPSVLLRGLGRQDDAHGGAVGLDVLDQDAAVVLVDDLLHDREPQAGSFRLGGHVRLEDASHHRLGDSGAVVAHGEKHPARAEAGW